MQFFLVCLLELLASWSCICFRAVGLSKAVNLTVGLAISGIILMALEIAVDLSE